mgnify:CR=1 FL=1
MREYVEPVVYDLKSDTVNIRWCPPQAPEWRLGQLSWLVIWQRIRSFPFRVARTKAGLRLA